MFGFLRPKKPSAGETLAHLAKPCDHMDPMWTGEKQDGASLTMLARRVAPQGGTN